MHNFYLRNILPRNSSALLYLSCINDPSLISIKAPSALICPISHLYLKLVENRRSFKLTDEDGVLCSDISDQSLETL
jgi:hypothetical protein